MDELSEILLKVKVPTLKLTSETIQAVLIATKKCDNICDEYNELWNEITQTLWVHLQTGLQKFDDQLLCATCFYAVLSICDKKEMYLKELLDAITDEIKIRENNNRHSNPSHVVSLMYGIFQSSFLTQESRKNSSVLANLLNMIFKLLMLMAYEYSKFTFVVFKTINSFKKVCGTDLQKYLFNKENVVKLCNLVNHNWENPITGVRDLNKGIFQTLISEIDERMYEEMFNEINGFYWNKAKYLMLAEYVRQSKEDVTQMVKTNKWIDGLMNSLYKPGLVSAGADMYFEIFKKLKLVNEWIEIFLTPVIEVLRGSSNKAMENFSSYWCLTTFKSFPSLAQEILLELERTIPDDSEKNKYSSLCIMKQANKLGLLEKNWQTNKNSYIELIVLHGLDHCSNKIRMMAFEILCISQTKSLPEKMQYDLLLKFVNHNLNSDCTVLRISMLKSFSCFLTQLHISYLNYFNNGQDSDKENLIQFCFLFQEFICKNLRIDGNYQRKITCIKLAHIFLNDLNELPRKRQKQTKKSDKTIIQMLKEEEKWIMFEEKVINSLTKLLKDPAEDIRENVVQILMNHYTQELRQTERMNTLMEDALKFMCSKFFYEISCGQSMFKLILNLLIVGHVEATFRNIEDVFKFAFNELITEYKLNRSIVDSIENGKQLHSYMSILYVVLEICFQNNYKIIILNDHILELLNALEGISNQFAWEEESSTSSDFSKMSDMVQCLIANSGFKPCNENDDTKISGLHQIVLNCLWLNVKVSCELSALLIKYQTVDRQIAVCKTSLAIISHVLETCRHKGAIEAAGVALGQSIQYLTSLPEDVDIAKLPFEFLKSKLDELISEAARMASVTRRGAGLSIMVHRIVSSDSKRGKPLFHYFMKTILETCNKTEDIPTSSDNARNIDDEKDLPKAIYIHFLTRIVTDSSLASDMMFYAAKLAELAFGNLTSPYWQIRNAALQLYGALIQKLIGQKKASGADDETVATVASDELRTHSPQLWNHIRHQISDCNYEDKIQFHSNLVPILNMLANLARRYNFVSDILDQQEADAQLLNNLISLLDSPIYTVRRLTAKCIYNIYSLEVIHEKLMTENGGSENYLHGCLMLVANYYKLYFPNNIYTGKNNSQYLLFDDLRKKFAHILKAKEHSYLCKEIFEDSFVDIEMQNVQEALVVLNKNSYLPGIFQWANTRIRKCIFKTSWKSMSQVLSILLAHKGYENYCEMVLEKLENESDVAEEYILGMINVLAKNGSSSTSVWKTLYLLFQRIPPAMTHNIPEIHKYVQNIPVSYKLRYMIPLAARVAAVSGEASWLINIIKIIETLTDPATDVEMRSIAALANNEIVTEISRILPEEVRIISIKSAVILLQDEDEDVRMLNAEFYPKAMNLQISLQPYICLLKILDYNFLSTLLSQNGISVLCKELTKFLEKNSIKNVDDYNPFANESNNIYLEANVLRQLIKELARE